MRRSYRDKLAHGAAALLLGTGLSLTLLKTAGMLSWWPLTIALLVGTTAVICLVSFWRVAALAAAGVGVAATGVWLLSGGAGTAVELVRAVALQFSGFHTVLPLYGRELAVCGGILSALAGYWLTSYSVGPYPSLCLVLLSTALLWLGDQTEALWCLLPAVVACVAMLLQGGRPEIRLTRLIPLAAVCVLLSFLGLASGGAVVQPMKETADEIRQRIYDRLFFTDPRDVFSLASEGFYPQGQSQLGGKPNLQEHAVMLVETPRRAYLRGVTKNVYTGRMWLDDTGSRRYLWSSLRWQDLRDGLFNMHLPEPALAQSYPAFSASTLTIRMLRDGASTLFVPQRIRHLGAGGDLVPYFNTCSEVFATRNLQPGDTWTVTAVLLQGGTHGLDTLLSACETKEDPQWNSVNQTYTALPDHLERSVYELAWAAVANAKTPYQKALALQTYLSTHYRYTLDVADQPTGQDFVSTFLLQTKEGYCTYFASAMTVMCRMVGLPARYVEGYVAQPDENGQALVTGLDGHAWTEVYMKGFGWLTFDATPWTTGAGNAPPTPQKNGQENPSPSAQPSNSPSPSPSPRPTPTPTASGNQEDLPTPSPAPSHAPQPSEAPTAAPSDAPREENAPPPDLSLLWWILLLAALAAAIAWRVRQTTPERLEARETTEFGRWRLWTREIHANLRLMGYPRAATESPLQYAARIDGLGRLSVSMAPQGDAETLMIYGHAEPYPTETEDARRVSRAVWQAMNRRQRLHRVMQRAFLPGGHQAKKKAA